jgi:hypothetical protein
MHSFVTLFLVSGCIKFLNMEHQLQSLKECSTRYPVSKHKLHHGYFSMQSASINESYRFVAFVVPTILCMALSAEHRAHKQLPVLFRAFCAVNPFNHFFTLKMYISTNHTLHSPCVQSYQRNGNFLGRTGFGHQQSSVDLLPHHLYTQSFHSFCISPYIGIMCRLRHCVAGACEAVPATLASLASFSPLSPLAPLVLLASPGLWRSCGAL